MSTLLEGVTLVPDAKPQSPCQQHHRFQVDGDCARWCSAAQLSVPGEVKPALQARLRNSRDLALSQLYLVGESVSLSFVVL